jgi:hypothetical protein
MVSPAMSAIDKVAGAEVGPGWALNHLPANPSYDRFWDEPVSPGTTYLGRSKPNGQSGTNGKFRPGSSQSRRSAHGPS